MNTPSRGRRGNQPNVWYNRTAYSQVSLYQLKLRKQQTWANLILILILFININKWLKIEKSRNKLKPNKSIGGYYIV